MITFTSNEIKQFSFWTVCITIVLWLLILYLKLFVSSGFKMIQFLDIIWK